MKKVETAENGEGDGEKRRLRDEFAGKALAGILTSQYEYYLSLRAMDQPKSEEWRDMAAAAAYLFADALMKARG
jgi:hypothetical protein